MKVINLLLICSLFLVGCSSQSNNSLVKSRDESVGFMEPISPPRNQDEINYYDLKSSEREPGSFTEKYSSILNDPSNKVEVDNGESYDEENFLKAYYKAQELFLDKNFYTNIKLSYLEDNPDVFENALVAFQGEIIKISYIEMHEELGEQIFTLSISDGTTEQPIEVYLGTVIHEDDLDIEVEYKNDKLKEIGLFYTGDIVTIYGVMLDPSLADNLFPHVDAKIVKIKE